MRMLKVFTYAGVHEYIRADLIESVTKPSGLVHDHGCLTLTSGRVVSLGDDGEAEWILAQLDAVLMPERGEGVGKEKTDGR